jgi:hypothetical protein
MFARRLRMVCRGFLALRCAHPGLSASNAHPATSRQRAPWSRVILLAVLSIMALNVAVPVTVVSLIS